MSAEEIIRQRKLVARSPEEKRLHALVEEIPLLWRRLQSAASQAPSRLERYGWPDGELVRVREYGTWNSYRSQVESSGEWLDLATWRVWTHKDRDSDGVDTYHHLLLGSNGQLYQNGSWPSYMGTDAAAHAPFEYFAYMLAISPRMGLPTESSLISAKTGLQAAIAATARLGY